MSQVRALRRKSYSLSGYTPSLRDDPQFPALARRRVTDDTQFFLQPLQLALLGLARLLGVSPLGFGLFVGLFSKIGNRDAAPEDLVAAKPEFGFGLFRKA